MIEQEEWWPQFVAVSAAGFGVMCLLYVWLALLVTFPPPISQTSDTLLKIFSGMTIFGFAGGILVRRLKIRIDRANLASVLSPLRILISLFLGAALVFAFIAINSRSRLSPDLDWRKTVFDTQNILGWMVLIWFVHAFSEELFFRGFVYNYLKRFLPVKVAILVSSLGFALAHMANLNKFVFLLFSALIITVVYERFGSLVYPVCTHASINIVAQFSVIWRRPFIRISIIPTFSCLIVLLLILKLREPGGSKSHIQSRGSMS